MIEPMIGRDERPRFLIAGPRDNQVAFRNPVSIGEVTLDCPFCQWTLTAMRPLSATQLECPVVVAVWGGATVNGRTCSPPMSVASDLVLVWRRPLGAANDTGSGADSADLAAPMAVSDHLPVVADYRVVQEPTGGVLLISSLESLRPRLLGRVRHELLSQSQPPRQD